MSTEELIVVEVSYANELHYSIQHYELRIYLAIRYSLLSLAIRKWSAGSIFSQGIVVALHVPFAISQLT